ncbi:MAG TPA: Pls/PosA family non-ribosomal peptide synthetase [Citricoccus sp.]
MTSPDDQSVRWRPGERMEDLFEEQCDALAMRGRADQLAVDTGDRSLTYGQLDAMANQLARYLLADGAKAGDRIALLFDQAIWSYAAMLAVLKIRAAYVPLDAGFPSDRIGYIMEDSGCTRVLTLNHLMPVLPETSVIALTLDTEVALIKSLPGGRLAEGEKPEPVEDLAYIIYTSGSTGRPKGVAIEHPSICNFIRVAAEVYGYETEDRVYQGLTIAFDFSVEEMWVPWMVGATLVPKPSSVSLLGADLEEFLVKNRITAMCCVPTLLATIEGELPDMRFLLVSGEACPRDLAERWHRPGRRFLNVYGPTEATVTATMEVLQPGKPITLGQPLPTYTTMILDPEEPRALAQGEMGELGIAGIGVAAGYLNNPEKTDAVFIDDFLDLPNNPSGKIYRSGDLCRINEDGEIEYFGRIDTQVKIRGYRIELSEIESVLLQVPGIAQAVVDTHEPAPGMTELAAYYTLRSDVSSLDPVLIQDELRERLPGYMVPAYYEQLETMPMLPSDKADRKSLPVPTNRLGAAANVEYVAPETGTERALAEQLAGVLGMSEISVEAHLFEELGVNSLTVARFSAALRRHTDLPPIGVQDIYQAPTLRRLAATLETGTGTGAATWADPYEVPNARRATTFDFVLTGVLQAVIALAYSGTMMFTLVAGYEWVILGNGFLELWGRSVAFTLGFVLLLCGAPIALKWLIIGRWKEQHIRIWSLAYVRFWFVKALVQMNPMAVFVGTPVLPFYLRLLGAKVGSNVTLLGWRLPVCTDLITIGDNTVIHKETHLLGYRAYQGWIQTGRITLGRNVHVSEKCVLDIHTAMEDGAQLGHTSSLQRTQTVPAGESWHGSPAVPATVKYQRAEPMPTTWLRRFTYGLSAFLTNVVVFAPLPLVVIALLLPPYLETGHFNPANPAFYADLALVALVIVIGGLLALLLVATTVPRLLNKLLTPGRTYPLYGMHYAVHRAIFFLTDVFPLMHLTADSSLVVHYLRLLGYKQPDLEQTGSNFGPEITHENPYLTTVGSGTMVSDGLSIMNAEYSGTSFRVMPVTIGAKNFFGNDVPYPAGARTGDNVLFGSKTLVPIDGEIRENVGLLGSPPFEIPRTSDPKDAALRIDSPEGIREGLRGKNRHNAMTIVLFLLSRWVLAYAGLLAAVVVVGLYPEITGLGLLVGVVGYFTFFMLFAILCERAVYGFKRMEPTKCSIYDVRFWRHERFWRFINYPLPALDGTPFKPMFWRLYGVRMGKRVYDDGCVIPEKTLVTIGDDVTLNNDSIVQCHSMEDGLFKLDAINIGNDVTIGVYIYLHYDVEMGDGSVLEPDAFLMKGARVPAGTRYGGNPAQEIGPVRATVDA